MRPHRFLFSTTWAWLGCAALISCGGERAPVQPPQPSKESALVNTYINKYIEIDQVNGGPGDANLIPGDPNPWPPPLTAGVTPSWTDWDQVGPVGYQHTDITDPDISSFPRSIGCVGTSKVLSKMDLTYVGLANNKDYAYFTVQRANNNGDAGYYWLMTKQEPSQEGTITACKTGEKSLEYTISPDDVLLVGHFQPSADPLLRVFRATPPNNQPVNVDAIAAIDFTNVGLWSEENSAIAAVAVNTSPADPASWDVLGVDKQAIDEGMMEAGIFAEAAVKTELFTSGSICGAAFWGTVITRSSGSGGTTPDLKDFYGPEKFSFGNVNGALTVTGDCTQEIEPCATLTGMDDEAVTDATCAWTITSGGDSFAGPESCCGKISLDPGTYEVSVTITDPASGCAATPETKTITVYPPVEAEVTLTPNCLSGFEYFGSGSGGDGSYSYAWKFEPPDSVTPDFPDQAAGYAQVSKGNELYTATLTVTDSRGCPGEAVATTRPYDPVEVLLTLGPAVDVCSTNSDAAGYVATATGGDETYTFNWNVVSDDGLTCLVSNLDNTSTCTMDPSDSLMCTSGQISVVVGDSSGMCLTAGAGPASYVKTTTVSSAL